MSSETETPVMVGIYTLEEVAELDDMEGPQALQEKVSEILSGLATVSVERADKYCEALGNAYTESGDEDFCSARDEVLEDDEMRKIDDDLYAEVYDRLQIPKDNPDETLIGYLSEAWDEALEETVLDNWV